MQIKQGSLLHINHSRKGQFHAIAIKDFDTEMTEFYPVRIASTEEGGNSNIVTVGLTTEWRVGEEIPCRKSLCKLELVETPKPELSCNSG